ncbi:hypothetical protein FRC04_004486 [Tulasnella sp. 424]|nr:hypothetical protein FRC04_004486 [Tulasnella sp. 424]KAG8976555.1 hypothetical protein FRC05_003394 [Tulasnella sp. 425]
MLTRISSKSTTQAYSAAQRCLSIRYNSTQSSLPSSSPQDAPPQTLNPSSSEIDLNSKPTGFEPKRPHRHPKSKPIDPKLPAPALRRLFALHHASRNFITPQTLDKAIDAAFATSNHLTPYPTRVEKSLRELDRDVSARRTEDQQTYPFGPMGPVETERQEQKQLRDLETYGAGMRTSDGGSIPMPVYGQAHLQHSARDSEVRAALYGVEQAGDVTMPGLDSLEDELAAKRLEKSRREARIAEQQGRESSP